MAWDGMGLDWMAWHGMARHGMARHGMARHGMARHHMARHGKTEGPAHPSLDGVRPPGESPGAAVQLVS